MRHTLKLVVVSLTLAACADSSQEDIAHNGSQVDTAHQADTTQKVLPAFQPVTKNHDTLLVERQAAVFIEPDSLRIERQKSEVGEEDFYIGADDYLYYLNIAQEFLDSVKMTTLNAKDKKYIKFVHSDKTQQIVIIDKLSELWSIYFFDPAKKAKQVDMTMIDEEYTSYFK